MAISEATPVFNPNGKIAELIARGASEKEIKDSIARYGHEAGEYTYEVLDNSLPIRSETETDTRRP